MSGMSDLIRALAADPVEGFDGDVDLERRVHWLWLVVCVGIPVALVVGAVLGHFTWGSQ